MSKPPSDTSKAEQALRQTQIGQGMRPSPGETQTINPADLQEAQRRLAEKRAAEEAALHSQVHQAEESTREGQTVDDEDNREVTTVRDNLKAPLTSSKQRVEAYVMVIAGANVGKMYKVGGTTEIGRGLTADIQLTDTEISRNHATMVREGEKIYVQDLGSTNGTFVNGTKVDKRQELRDGDKIQVGTTTILKFSYEDELEEQFRKALYEAAVRDALTGALNRKVLFERLEGEIAFSRRHQSALSLLIFDIDHFKKINDTHGHLAGDYVLKTLSMLVLKSIRAEDVFVRYGGEEFVIITRLDSPGGLQFSERLRKMIDEHAFVFEDDRIAVTISSGVATIPDLEVDQPSDLVALADKALYQAKRSGRNKSCVFEPEVEALGRAG